MAEDFNNLNVRSHNPLLDPLTEAVESMIQNQRNQNWQNYLFGGAESDWNQDVDDVGKQAMEGIGSDLLDGLDDSLGAAQPKQSSTSNEVQRNDFDDFFGAAQPKQSSTSKDAPSGEARKEDAADHDAEEAKEAQQKRHKVDDAPKRGGALVAVEWSGALFSKEGSGKLQISPHRKFKNSCAELSKLIHEKCHSWYVCLVHLKCDCDMEAKLRRTVHLQLVLDDGSVMETGAQLFRNFKDHGPVAKKLGSAEECKVVQLVLSNVIQGSDLFDVTWDGKIWSPRVGRWLSQNGELFDRPAKEKPLKDVLVPYIDQAVLFPHVLLNRMLDDEAGRIAAINASMGHLRYVMLSSSAHGLAFLGKVLDTVVRRIDSRLGVVLRDLFDVMETDLKASLSLMSTADPSLNACIIRSKKEALEVERKDVVGVSRLQKMTWSGDSILDYKHDSDSSSAGSSSEDDGDGNDDESGQSNFYKRLLNSKIECSEGMDPVGEEDWEEDWENDQDEIILGSLLEERGWSEKTFSSFHVYQSLMESVWFHAYTSRWTDPTILDTQFISCFPSLRYFLCKTKITGHGMQKFASVLQEFLEASGFNLIFHLMFHVASDVPDDDALEERETFAEVRLSGQLREMMEEARKMATQKLESVEGVAAFNTFAALRFGSTAHVPPSIFPWGQMSYGTKLTNLTEDDVKAKNGEYEFAIELLVSNSLNTNDKWKDLNARLRQKERSRIALARAKKDAVFREHASFFDLQSKVLDKLTKSHPFLLSLFRVLSRLGGFAFPTLFRKR